MKKMQVLTIVGITAGIIILIVLIRLGLLLMDVSGFQKYWTQRAQKPGDFIYLALGDSAAQGIGASQPQKGYVGLIADQAAAKTGKSVKVVNLSVSGAVVKDVLDKQLPASRDIKPDLVTIEIGANDVATFDEKRFTSEFQALVRQLPQGTYVSNMPYFATRPGRRPAAFKISEIIATTLKQRPDLKLIDLQTITQDRDSWLNYAADLFHPNDRAYKNWAEVFWKEIEKDIDG